MLTARHNVRPAPESTSLASREKGSEMGLIRKSLSWAMVAWHPRMSRVLFSFQLPPTPNSKKKRL